MSMTNPFYEQMRQQFDRIIVQDKRRRRRISFVLLAVHLCLVIAAVFYLGQRSTFAFWDPIHTEIVLVLWSLLAISWVVHLAVVVFMNRTVVADTVRESLMLLAAHQHQNDTSEVGEKRKRNRHESAIETLESDSPIIADDGELRHTRQWRN